MSAPVFRARRVEMPLVSGDLPFEKARRGEIDAHWAQVQAANPALFDGRVHFTGRAQRDGDAFHVPCLPARFATLHYWRHVGYPPIDARHVFGCAILRAACGAILLARMSEATSNAGKIYFPGGVIDETDVQGGQIDIRGHILRELWEETGLPRDLPVIGTEYVVSATPISVGIGLHVDLPFPADEARAVILAAARENGDGEIADILPVSTPADMNGLEIIAYARQIIDWTFTD